MTRIRVLTLFTSFILFSSISFSAAQKDKKVTKTTSPKWQIPTLDPLTLERLERQDDERQMEIYNSLSFQAKYVYDEDRVRKNLKSDLAKWPNQFLPSTTIKVNSNKEILESELTDDEPFRVYKYGDLPIYHIKFHSMALRGLASDRLYNFVEVDGHSLLDDEALHKKMNELGPGSGSDLKISDVAKFFSEAKKKNIALNPIEERIKSELLNVHLLNQISNGYEVSKTAAILFTSQEAKPAVLEHELNHGLYFTDGTYSDAVLASWKSLNNEEKALVKKTISACSKYDLSDDDLVAREFVAYFRDLPTLKTFLPPEKFDQNLMSQIEKLSLKAKALDRTSQFYQPSSQNAIPAQGISEGTH